MTHGLVIQHTQLLLTISYLKSVLWLWWERIKEEMDFKEKNANIH